MRHPKHIDLSLGVVLNLTRAVSEDPIAEAFLELYGRYRNDSVSIYNAFNLSTAEKKNDTVNYGNWSAKERLDAFERALQISGDKNSEKSTRIGQGHFHTYDKYGPTISREDFVAVRERMNEHSMDRWIELHLYRTFVEPIGDGVFYSKNRGVPIVLISPPHNKKHSGFYGRGLKIAFFSTYIYRYGERLRSKRLPVIFEEKASSYFTDLRDQQLTLHLTLKPSGEISS